MLQQFISSDVVLYGIIAAASFFVIMLILLVVLAIKNSNGRIMNQALEKQLSELHLRNLQLEEVNSALSNDNTRLKAEYAGQRSYMEEKLQYIEQSKNDMAIKFRDISGEILRLQSEQINENQKNSLSALLEPFREQLKTFKDEVSKANNENIKNKSSFDEQFKNLLHLNQTLTSEAQNLTNALRGSKKMQGDWGEVELNRILEISGLQKNIDFYAQENIKSSDNLNFRPDIVVRLPNNRSVIIDSKVSMNDYINYINSDDETEKKYALQRHIQCIKKHIDELSAKEYQKLLKDESLDYVVIFIPIESAFAAAIKEDSSLYDYAYRKNVALTTPSSLLPILRTVENLWQIENRNKYVQKIAEVGGSLHDKLAGFVEDMQKIDKNLLSVRQSYDAAISKLTQGRGNAMSLANKLKEYGAKANKVISVEFDNNEDDLLKIDENNIKEKVS